MGRAAFSGSAGMGADKGYVYVVVSDIGMDLVCRTKRKEGSEYLRINFASCKGKTAGSANLIGLGNTEVNASLRELFDEFAGGSGKSYVIGISEYEIVSFTSHLVKLLTVSFTSV